MELGLTQGLSEVRRRTLGTGHGRLSSAEAAAVSRSVAVHWYPLDGWSRLVIVLRVPSTSGVCVCVWGRRGGGDAGSGLR